MLLRDSAIYMASRGLPGALGFATTVLLSWVLPPGDFGLYGLGIAIVALANSIAFEWLGACFARWHESHRSEPSFLPTVRILFAAAAAAGALPVLLACALGLAGGHGRLACVLVFGAVAFGWFELAAKAQICRSRPTRFLRMMLARNGLILLGGVSVAAATRSAEATLLFCFGAIAAAGCLFLGADDPVPRPGDGGATAFDPALAREFLAYGAPVGLTMVLSGSASTAAPIMVGALAGPEAVGAFTLGLTIVQSTLGVISGGVSSAGYPAAVRAVESGDPARAEAALARNYALLLGLLLPAGVGLAMLSPAIAAVFVQPRYGEALARTMPWLAAAAVLAGLRATHVDYAFHLGKRTGYLIQVVGLAAAVNIGLGAALIPPLREVGASIAMCVGFGAALAHAALLAGRAHPLPMPARETCAVAAATAAMAAALGAASAAAPAGPLGLALEVACGFAAYGVALGALCALAKGPRRRLGRGLAAWVAAPARQAGRR